MSETLLVIVLMRNKPCPSYRASVSKQVFEQNLLYENEFNLDKNEHVGGTHFHVSGFAQRQKATRTIKEFH